jgi:formiminotetrahydrofolate cyclodeaminase
MIQRLNHSVYTKSSLQIGDSLMDDSFLVALAAPNPIPGGGAAAAHGALVGFALLEKIVRVELQRQEISSEAKAMWDELLEQVCSSSRVLRTLRDEDGRAYMRFAEAKSSGEEAGEVLGALEEATDSPVRIMETAHDGLSALSLVGKYCKAHLLSDLLVVCELIQSAIQGAYQIAQANLLSMDDFSRKGDYQKKLSRLRERCQESTEQVRNSILARTAGNH